jgi:hypothetical protein
MYCEYEDLVQDGKLMIHTLEDMGEDYAFGAINKHYTSVWDKAIARAPFHSRLRSIESMQERGQDVPVSIAGTPSEYCEDTWKTLRPHYYKCLSDMELQVLDSLADKASIDDISIDLGVLVGEVLRLKSEALRKIKEEMHECG